MKPQEIRKILTVAKDLGVKELSYQGLTVQFFDKRTKQKKDSPSHPAESIPAALEPSTPPTPQPELTSEGIPTEDELLLMSTPFYDHMQMMKSLKEEADHEDLISQ